MKTGIRTGLGVIVSKVPLSHGGALLNRSAGACCSLDPSGETSGDEAREMPLGEKTNGTRHSPFALR